MDETVSKSELERQNRLSDVRKRKIKRIFTWLVVLAVIAAAIWGLVFWSKKAAQNKPGEAIAELGREHVEIGSTVSSYNSNPPTSGPHYPTWSSWGIHDEIIVDEYLVHNLEHGGIWISYRDSSDQELISKLKDIVDDYSLKVVLTPRPRNDSRIAVAAWGRLMKLEQFDEKEIKRFIAAFINRGPENVPY